MLTVSKRQLRKEYIPWQKMYIALQVTRLTVVHLLEFGIQPIRNINNYIIIIAMTILFSHWSVKKFDCFLRLSSDRQSAVYTLLL